MVQKSVWDKLPLILAYHSVSDDRRDGLSVSVSDFDFQMDWLRRHRYTSLTLSGLTRWQPSKREKPVAITFDDGYADNYTQAFPILKRYGFTATIFLVSKSHDTGVIHDWDRPKVIESNDFKAYELLSWAQVHEMANSGIEFGSHSCTHRNLTQLSFEERQKEINQSRKDLQEKLGCAVDSFCYPRGDLNEETIEIVKQAGYACAVVTPPRASIPISRYTLRRVGLYRTTSRTLFRIKINAFVRRHYDFFRSLSLSS